MIPEFLSGLINARYPKEEAEMILTGYALRRPVTFRVNTLKATAKEVEEECAALSLVLEPAPVPNAYILRGAREGAIINTSLYREGKIYLQSLSSMLPPYLLAPEAGESILDMTAAPGGKTSLLSALSGGKAFLTACEKDKLRLERLKYNLNKLGVPRTSVLAGSALALDEYFRFDKILLDAPCSGSGTLIEGEESKISPKLVSNSAALQEKLLKKALKLLKKDSLLVYSTCSVLKEENDDILERVLKEGSCELLPVEFSFCVPRISSLKNTWLIPPNELFEGFFVALLKKR